MIYLYAVLAALSTGCLARWFLSVHAAVRNHRALKASLSGALGRGLADAGAGIAVVCAFWLPIFARFSALGEKRDIDPVFVYGVTFIAVLWLALTLFPIARRHSARQD